MRFVNVLICNQMVKIGADRLHKYRYIQLAHKNPIFTQYIERTYCMHALEEEEEKP